MKKISLLLTAVGFGLFNPLPVLAAGIPDPSTWLTPANSGGLPVGGLNFVTGNVTVFVVSLLFFLVIVLSFIYLIIGAISLITSGGNKEGTAKAKGTITYALLGLVIGIASLIILSVIGTFLGFSLVGN